MVLGLRGEANVASVGLSALSVTSLYTITMNRGKKKWLTYNVN